MRTPLSSAPPQHHDDAPPVMRPRGHGLHVTAVVVADAAAMVACFAIAQPAAAGGAIFAVAMLGLDIVHPHRPGRLNPSALDDLPSLVVRAVIIAVAVDAAGLVVHGARFGAAGVLVTAGLFAGIAAVGRGIAYAVLRRLRASGRAVRAALVVGGGPAGEKIAWLLRSHPECGLTPVGFVDEPAAGSSVGDINDVARIVADRGISHIFVAFAQPRDGDLVGVLRACQRLDCEIFVVPRLFELGMAGCEVDHLWGIPLLRLRRTPGGGLAWVAKRIADRVLAAVALVLVGPIMLAVALAVRLELGPGVLFRQVRVGLDGRLFLLVKFRSLRQPRSGERTDHATSDGERMSRIGGFLRRSSLDELPQLWNVLRGDMSLVGPRPEQPLYVSEFVREHPGYHSRLRVPAGITGWAQIHDLRGDTSIEDRVRFDNYYIDHWSLWRDIKILIATAGSVFGLRGR